MEKENKLVKGLTLVTLFTLITGARWHGLGRSCHGFLDRAGPRGTDINRRRVGTDPFHRPLLAELCSAMP